MSRAIRGCGGREEGDKRMGARSGVGCDGRSEIRRGGVCGEEEGERIE